MSGTETKSPSEVFTIAGETQAEQGKLKSKSKKVSFFEQYAQPCLAELLGTTLFVFAGCASVMDNTAPHSIQPALAQGLALAILIAAFGEISGGHFNPAVSLSVYLCGGMKLVLLLPYFLAQLTGGMIGAALAQSMFPTARNLLFSSGAYIQVKGSEFFGGAIVAELMMTLFLTLVVCMVAVNGRTRSMLGSFVIGLTVTTGVLGIASVSGGCMNPARAFGPAVAANFWDHHWIYWVGPFCGSLLSVSFVRLLFGDQGTRVMLKDD